MFKPEQGNILNPHEINWPNKRLTHIEHKRMKERGRVFVHVCVSSIQEREREREKEKEKQI